MLMLSSFFRPHLWRCRSSCLLSSSRRFSADIHWRPTPENWMISWRTKRKGVTFTKVLAVNYSDFQARTQFLWIESTKVIDRNIIEYIYRDMYVMYIHIPVDVSIRHGSPFCKPRDASVPDASVPDGHGHVLGSSASRLLFSFKKPY